MVCGNGMCGNAACGYGVCGNMVCGNGLCDNVMCISPIKEILTDEYDQIENTIHYG